MSYHTLWKNHPWPFQTLPEAMIKREPRHDLIADLRADNPYFMRPKPERKEKCVKKTNCIQR